MQKLINNDMMSIFEYLRIIKDFYDDGGHSVPEFFSYYNEDEEMYETCSFEDIMNIPEFQDWEELFFEDENGNIDDSSPYGEIWTFSSREMKEYYECLKRLRKTRSISKKEYDMKLFEMEDCAKKHITNAQMYYYSDIYAEIHHGKGRNPEHCIRIHLSYDTCYSLFVMACGVLTLFDKYKQNLKELKEKYGLYETLSEAA